jgi:polyhydroxyalkanoate synthesis regulator phasin
MHAELRAKIRAEAAEHRRYGDDLWNRGKKERSSYEHERAAKLEDLAHELDLPAAIAQRDAEARKLYDLLVQLNIIKRLQP